MHHFSNFTPGEKVIVDSAANQSFEGTYQFDSVINDNFVYIKFDSRTRVMIWEKSMVRAVDLLLTNSERRVTRQTTRRAQINQQNVPSNLRTEDSDSRNGDVQDDADIIEVSDEATVSDNSFGEDESNEIDLTNASNTSPSSSNSGTASNNNPSGTEDNANGGIATNSTSSVDNRNAVRDRSMERYEDDNNIEFWYSRPVRRRNLPDGTNELSVDYSDSGLDRDEFGLPRLMEGAPERFHNFQRFIRDTTRSYRERRAATTSEEINEHAGNELYATVGARDTATEEEIDLSFGALLLRFGDGNENRPKLTRAWLATKGLIPNNCDADCAICGDNLPRGTMLYDINCLCWTKEQYRYCMECFEGHVDAQ